jgi:antitoxin component YwqK of YwqJK toxin-antitoxin module
VANDRKLDFLDQKLIRVAILRGNKEAETLYKDGRLHRLTEWFPNGTKAAEVEYFEGDRRRYRGYWENGNLNEDVHYMNGEIEGSFTNWYPDGIWTFWHTTLEFHNDILIS